MAKAWREQSGLEFVMSKIMGGGGLVMTIAAAGYALVQNEVHWTFYILAASVGLQNIVLILEE